MSNPEIKEPCARCAEPDADTEKVCPECDRTLKEGKYE